MVLNILLVGIGGKRSRSKLHARTVITAGGLGIAHSLFHKKQSIDGAICVIFSHFTGALAKYHMCGGMDAANLYKSIVSTTLPASANQDENNFHSRN